MNVRYTEDGYELYLKDSLSAILDAAEAVQLVKSLYAAGLEFDMPDVKDYNAGRMEALQAHLDDMRRLVFLEDGAGKVK